MKMTEENASHSNILEDGLPTRPDDSGLISSYSRAVFDSLPVALKFFKENKKRIAEEFPEAVLEFELNIYTRHLAKFPKDIHEKILDIYLEKVLHQKEIYHTSDSAMAYNILSVYFPYYFDKITSIENPKYNDDRLLELHNFLREQKTRFWWQLLLIIAKSQYRLNNRINIEEFLKEFNIVNDNLLKNGTSQDIHTWQVSQEDIKRGAFGVIIKDFMVDILQNHVII